MAKAEIARKTGLSAQTVSVIMRGLEADGLLVRGEPQRGKRGQPSVPFALAKDGAFFLGLKIGRRRLDVVLTDFLGEVQHRFSRANPYPDPDSVIEFALESIDQARSELSEAQQARIAGLGIALPFQLWEWGKTLGSDAAGMDAWRTRDIAQDLAERCEFPVFLCNDASAACGAELVFGASNKPRDFLYLFVGFFIGAGLVLDNTLFTGSTGNAAALGSMYVPDEDGELRQLVEVASLATLQRAASAEDGGKAKDWDSPTDWQVSENVLDKWLSRAAKAIGHAIQSSVSLLDMDQVLIDGWMPEDVRAELVRRIQHQITEFPVPGIQTPNVLEGSIGSDARVLGAASLPLSERFLVERKTFLKGLNS